MWSMPWRHLPLVFAAVFAPLMFVVGELDTDFQVYSLMAHVIESGGVVYRDLFDHKPPLVYALLLPAARWGSGYASFVWLGVIVASLCHLPLFALAASAGRSALSGWLAVGLTLCCTALASIEHGYLAGVLNLLVLAWSCSGALLLTRAMESGSSRAPPAALLVGAALCGGLALATRFSPSLTLATGVCGVALAWRRSWSLAIVLRWALFVLLLGALPAVTLLWALGAEVDSTWRSLIEFNRVYAEYGQLRLAPRVSLGQRLSESASAIVTAGALPLGLACASLVRLRARVRQLLPALGAPLMLLAAEATLILPQGIGSKAYPYYTVLGLVSVVAGVLVGAALQGTARWVRVLVCLVLFAPWGPVGLQSAGLAARLEARPEPAVLDAIGGQLRDKQRLYTLTHSPAIYIDVGGAPPVQFHAFNAAAWSWFGRQPQQVDQTWSALERDPPEWIVARPLRKLGPRGERLLERYDLVAELPSSFPPSLAPSRRTILLHQLRSDVAAPVGED